MLTKMNQGDIASAHPAARPRAIPQALVGPRSLAILRPRRGSRRISLRP